MTTHLVTFSDESMSRSRELCVASGKRCGVSVAHRFTPSDLSFHRSINMTDRGCGYWAWKPAIILETMNRIGLIDTTFGLPSNSVIVYADAGVEFIAPVSHIIDRMDQDIFLFGNNWEHAHWCKRDVVEAIWPCNNESRCPSPHYEFWDKFGKQVQASVIFFRVSDYTRAFVTEWLKWCLFESGRLIDDSPSRLPNHPEFQEHRHDQAILTTMAYRDGISIHYWPAVYLPDDRVYEKLDCYAGDNYERLFRHHRRRNHEWEQVA